ncbi:Transcription initiation factor TFIID subunit 5 [Smittium culicis]|nr:Transcription initiation factor TFIID subunit 5 [Smittium culicis]
MSENFVELALEFYNRFSGHFLERYSIAIQQLSLITQPHHVNDNETAKNFRTFRYSINMKQPAVELLLIFLESNNLILFIKIINSHLNIYINKSLPDSDNFKIDVGLTGSNLSEISQINNEQLKLGKLPLNPLLVEQMERFFSNAIPNKNSIEPDNADDNDSTNPANPKALQKVFEEIKETDINSPSPQDIPLPPL